MENAKQAQIKARWAFQKFNPLAVKIGRGLTTGAPILVVEFSERPDNAAFKLSPFDGFPVAMRIVKKEENDEGGQH